MTSRDAPRVDRYRARAVDKFLAGRRRGGRVSGNTVKIPYVRSLHVSAAARFCASSPPDDGSPRPVSRKLFMLDSTAGQPLLITVLFAVISYAQVMKEI